MVIFAEAVAAASELAVAKPLPSLPDPVAHIASNEVTAATARRELISSDAYSVALS
jgi:hypothetical protein